MASPFRIAGEVSLCISWKNLNIFFVEKYKICMKLTNNIETDF
jgi:hypothetical protein